MGMDQERENYADPAVKPFAAAWRGWLAVLLLLLPVLVLVALALTIRS